MSANQVKRALARAVIPAAILAAGAVTVMIAMLAGAAGAQAAPPVKLVLTGHITNGFKFPDGVAVNNDAKSPEDGNLYVLDRGNSRVQELTATGVFVAMFGWEVNKTKVEAHAARAEQNICTAASKDTCQAGVKGTAAGQFSEFGSIVVDPASGDLYVAEKVYFYPEIGKRVQEFTGEGRFVREIGKEVNKTKKTNFCSEREVEEAGVECAGPALRELGAVEPSENGAFHFREQGEGLLAVGGPEDLLYVGEEDRVQEFKADGTWAGEIPHGPARLALDQETGDVYYVNGNTVREFDPSGMETASFAVSPGRAGSSVVVLGVAVDSAGHLVVTLAEGGGVNDLLFGALYDAGTGHRITTFTIPNEADPQGMAFSSGGVLYLAADTAQEVLSYTPDVVAELLTPHAACTPGPVSGSSVAFNCALEGEVNPDGVTGTEAFFEWGPTEVLGESTAKQKIATGALPVPVPPATLSGVRPNETLYYQLAGYDAPVQAPEELTSEPASVKTPAVAPRIAGAPSASFVTSSSAVLSGALNPENANTTYEFLYAPACASGEEACPAIAQAPGVQRTAVQESGVYGSTGATLEAVGLQPATTYRFALMAESSAGGAVNETGGAALPEGTFTTAPAPTPTAATGAASAIAATSATISGSVDPDGLAATYSFEVGVYEGAATQYGVVFSGSAGAGSIPVEETYALSGLQPGATYAFRITIHSGYIHNSDNAVHGAPALFATPAVPSVLSAPPVSALLATPAIAFPKAVSVKTSKQTKKKKKKKKKARKTAAKGKRNASAKGRRGRARRG